MTKYKNTDFTKWILIAMGVITFVVGIVVAVVTHNLMSLTPILIGCGSFIAGISRNGLKSHQNTMETSSQEIKQAIKDIQNHNKRQDEKIKDININLTRIANLMLGKNKKEVKRK